MFNQYLVLITSCGVGIDRVSSSFMRVSEKKEEQCAGDNILFRFDLVAHYKLAVVNRSKQGRRISDKKTSVQLKKTKKYHMRSLVSSVISTLTTTLYQLCIMYMSTSAIDSVHFIIQLYICYRQCPFHNTTLHLL